MKRYKVAVVDDHLLIANAIANVINRYDDYDVVFEAENGKVVVEKFKLPENIPDIILLDISMPEMDGISTARWLKENHPDVRVLVLSMDNDDLTIIRMVKAGARGYLLKNIHPAELKVALDEIMLNGHYFAEMIASRVYIYFASDRASVKSADLIAISDKEEEFLRLCCSELSYKEIAANMYCGFRTIEGYRDNLFRKLGLSTRVGLAMYAIKTGIHKF